MDLSILSIPGGKVSSSSDPTTASKPNGAVDKGLVHKHAEAEVLLSDFEIRSTASIISLARWPTEHDHYKSAAHTLDVLLMAETFRQASILLCHARLGVPLGWVFVMDSICLDVCKHGSVWEQRAPITVQVDAVKVEERSGQPFTLGIESHFSAGSILVGQGNGQLRVLDPRVYTRLRGPASTSSNRDLPRRENHQSAFALHEIVDYQMLGAWQLDFDPIDPFFFDHAVDHVPGMLLVAALRDAALEAAKVKGGEVVAFEIHFMRYLELDEPILLGARPGSSATIGDRVRLHLTVTGSGGRIAAEALATVAPQKTNDAGAPSPLPMD